MFCFLLLGFGAFQICPPKGADLEMRMSLPGLFLDFQMKLLRLALGPQGGG